MLGKITKEMADILSDSILSIQNALETNDCRWLSLLKYFNSAPSEEFSCKNCDTCLSEMQEIDVTSFARPLLNFLSEYGPLVRTRLIEIIYGANSRFQKMDEEIKRVAEMHHLFGLLRSIGVTRENGVKLLNCMIDAGLITYTNSRQGIGRQAAQLAISPKGQKILVNEKIKLMKMIHSSDSVRSLDNSTSKENCYLPTTACLKQLPFQEEEYNLPDNYEQVIKSEGITDEFLKVALQVPIFSGLISVDFVDHDTFVCVPKEVVASLYCENHNRIKPGWSQMLLPFHKYPRVISWREKKKWFGLTSFSGCSDFKGINFEFTCANAKDKCQAQCKWTSLGISYHGDVSHVVFKVMFKACVLEDGKTHTKNHHVHTYTQIPSSKSFQSSIDTCCNLDTSILGQEFLAFTQGKSSVLSPMDYANPIRFSMETNVQALEVDPYAAQSGSSTVTYNQARNSLQKARVESRPWLKDSDPKLSISQKLLLLKSYIDNHYWEKEKVSGLYSDNKKYTYYMESVTESTVGITVLITDLLGIKLYSLCADRAVISIDGTGRGADLKGRVMQYCVTGDLKNCFSRSDETKVGIYPFFEMWLIGKGTTNQANLESALLSFKSLVLQVTGKNVSPKYVKLDGEVALINACKVFGHDTRRLVEKYHANRKLEYNVCITGPLKGNGAEQAIFLKMWERFCDAVSSTEAQVIRSKLKERYSTFTGYDKILSYMKVYFDDPSLICQFGRSDLPVDIISKHNGPAEAESIFDKLKHDYTDPDFVAAKNVDDLLYGNWLVRKRLGVRFLLDWQNSKLPRGIKEVVKRYKLAYGINLDLDKKTKRTSNENVEGHSRSKKKYVNENDPGNNSEGDMNEPNEVYSLSTFSKSKKNRSTARRKLFKSHSATTSKVLSQIENTVKDLNQNDMRTMAISDNTSERHKSFNLPALPAVDVLIPCSQTEPNYDSWNEINIIEPKNLKFMPLDQYISIPKASSTFVMVSHILENILCPDEPLVSLHGCFMRYLSFDTENTVFAELYGCTNSGCRRDKYTPFIFKYVFSLSLSNENISPLEIEGLYHVVLRFGKFTEDSVLHRLAGVVPFATKNGIVKGLIRSFPLKGSS